MGRVSVTAVPTRGFVNNTLIFSLFCDCAQRATYPCAGKVFRQPSSSLRALGEVAHGIFETWH